MSKFIKIPYQYVNHNLSEKITDTVDFYISIKDIIIFQKTKDIVISICKDGRDGDYNIKNNTHYLKLWIGEQIVKISLPILKDDRKIVDRKVKEYNNLINKIENLLLLQK